MNVLHIGPISSVHTQIAAIGYRELGYSSVFLNTRKDRAFETIPGLPGVHEIVNPWRAGEAIMPGKARGSSMAASARDALRYLGVEDARLTSALRAVAARRQIDLVVGTWGLPVLEAMLAAETVFPRAGFVYNVLSVPELPVEGTGLRMAIWRAYMRAFDFIQGRAYRRMLKGCDVRVHAGELMRAYMAEKKLLTPPGVDIVRLERFSRAFFPKTRLPLLSAADGEPHVVHLGATNFSGLSIDNLAPQIGSLAAAGVHVHYSSPEAPEFGAETRRFLHTFPKFESSEISPHLAEFATQFDAAVLLYNVDRPYERFRNALPTRFLFALVTGIPIAVPRGLFQASEEYVKRHDIGFSYGSAAELRTILGDAERMKKLSANAVTYSSHLSLEDNLSEYESIFQTAQRTRAQRISSDVVHKP